MPPEELPIPLDIPWKLAATTQVLTSEDPQGATISLSYYNPRVESLEENFPDERLVYLKFTVSVSPCHLAPINDLNKFLREYLKGGLPVWHVQLDLKVTPKPTREGGIRPYFLSAAPLRRSMVETGVVGNDLFEGESDGVSVGRTASQLQENVSATVSSPTYFV